MTVREWVQSAKSRLASEGFEAADLEAQLLAAHVLLVDRPWLIAHSEEPFPELAGESVLAARLAHRPLAYILGFREFYGRRFTVRPGVLIPRHETELLVETALTKIEADTDGRAKVLDLGSGSGCIAITLKLERPRWTLVASDISISALEIASQNADDLNANISFVASDGFEKLGGELFDAIVTNPPYIGTDEPLPREVRAFEPHEALFSGQTGFEFYERLAREAPKHLRPAGLLFMEVGHRQAQAVVGLFLRAGWSQVEIQNDLSKIPRIVVSRH